VLNHISNTIKYVLS